MLNFNDYYDFMKLHFILKINKRALDLILLQWGDTVETYVMVASMTPVKRHDTGLDKM